MVIAILFLCYCKKKKQVCKFYCQQILQQIKRNKMSGPFYTVVEFPKENYLISIISSTWILEDDDGLAYCYWPKLDKSGKPLTDIIFKKMVEHHSEIDMEACEKCQINIKYKSRIYVHAIDKMKILKNQSSVSQTEDEENKDKTIKKRKSKKSQKFEFDSSDDEQLPFIKPPILAKDISTCIVSEVNKININSIYSPSCSKSFEMNSGSDNIESSEEESTEANKTLTNENESMTIIATESDPKPETYLCNGCKKAEELLPTILFKIEQLSDDIKYLLLCQQNSTSENVCFEDFSSCQTIQDLQTLEENLGNNDYFMKTLKILQVIGGKDAIDTTRRILTKILSLNLQKELNWTGRNNKIAFSKFIEVRKLILVAVKKNCLSRNATEKDVESVTKLFLRNSGDREGGRGKRPE